MPLIGKCLAECFGSGSIGTLHLDYKVQTHMDCRGYDCQQSDDGPAALHQRVEGLCGLHHPAFKLHFWRSLVAPRHSNALHTSSESTKTRS